jgi:hypothetical protein
MPCDERGDRGLSLLRLKGPWREEREGICDYGERVEGICLLHRHGQWGRGDCARHGLRPVYVGLVRQPSPPMTGWMGDSAN